MIDDDWAEFRQREGVKGTQASRAGLLSSVMACTTFTYVPYSMYFQEENANYSKSVPFLHRY